MNPAVPDIELPGGSLSLQPRILVSPAFSSPVRMREGLFFSFSARETSRGGGSTVTPIDVERKSTLCSMLFRQVVIVGSDSSWRCEVFNGDEKLSGINEKRRCRRGVRSSDDPCGGLPPDTCALMEPLRLIEVARWTKFPLVFEINDRSPDGVKVCRCLDFTTGGVGGGEGGRGLGEFGVSTGDGSCTGNWILMPEFARKCCSRSSDR